MSRALHALEVKRPTTSLKPFFRINESVNYAISKKPTRQKVALGKLIATQSTVHAGFRNQKNPTKGPIHVFRSPKGGMHIIEGHHRGARAAARGDKLIDAMIHRAPRKGKR